MGQACKTLLISEQTYYRWRREYGGMGVTRARKLKEMEKENTKLKNLVADLFLDNAILKEVLGSTQGWTASKYPHPTENATGYRFTSPSRLWMCLNAEPVG